MTWTAYCGTPTFGGHKFVTVTNEHSQPAKPGSVPGRTGKTGRSMEDEGINGRKMEVRKGNAEAKDRFGQSGFDRCDSPLILLSLNSLNPDSGSGKAL